MKNPGLMILCVAVVALSACGSGSESKQNAAARNTPKETIFSGYTRDVKKAKQVQKKLDDARKRLDARLKKAETGSGDSGD